ncbi:MAG TPA: hypothetical protein VMX35_10385 [Acidobacteriota bacterium]|nr:hypothetical protein [Acidobacteriota bacterium]
MMITTLFAAIIVAFSAVVYPAQLPPEQGNPIVEIQKRMVERIDYYFLKVESDCLLRVKDALYTRSEAFTLINCIQENYHQATITWYDLNQELIEAVAEMSISSVDRFVPEGPTTGAQRQQQTSFLASAHQRVTGWYKGLAAMIDKLFKAGMLDAEAAKAVVERLNESLKKVTVTAREAYGKMASDDRLSPDQVREILNGAMEGMFSTAREDVTGMRQLILESRVQLGRDFNETMKVYTSSKQLQEWKVGEMEDYSEVVEQFQPILVSAFESIQYQAWTVWADLRPEEAKTEEREQK